MRLVSWNVNGLRAAMRKGFLDFARRDAPDVLCLQETKLQAHQIPEALSELAGYRSWWNHSEVPGRSGVALLSRVEPRSVEVGFGDGRFAREGRTLVADFGDFLLFNGYFPNGGRGPERLQFKLDYYAAVCRWAAEHRERGRQVIITGDLNTAHAERDLARPRQNRNTSGFMDIEREWLSRLLADGGLTDTFRLFIEEGGHYSWWSYRAGARSRDIGWRLDYFLVSAGLMPRVASSTILKAVLGSDHCPVALELTP